jgi:selenide,water dikinase
VTDNKNIIAGYENSEDAGVFKISEELALVQTLDFLTPVVDDPFIFGQIAAANSLSDVYAMGGKPLTAMNIVCFPTSIYPSDVLKDVLMGGRNKIDESGAVLLGGHSVEDNEFKYGLSVTGTVDPGKVKRNSGALTGHDLILTKAIGTGIVATALKGGVADDDAVGEMIEVMTRLNSYILEIADQHEIGGLTDITGFGLGGHLMEMACASKKRVCLYSEKIPLISMAKDYAQMGLIPAGAYRNRNYCSGHVFFKSKIEKALEDIIFDPQTSGGLLMTCNKMDSADIVKKIQSLNISAEIIGEVTGEDKEGIVEIF